MHYTLLSTYLSSIEYARGLQNEAFRDYELDFLVEDWSSSQDFRLSLRPH